MLECLLEKKVKPLVGATEFDTGIPITESLWQRIKTKTPNIHLSITNKCNQNCSICFMSNADESFSFNEYELFKIISH